MRRPDLHTDYGNWSHPAAGYSVQYALPVFREIEFVVNDGYRRIPHGGVETGGLLFGTVEGSTIRIDSFNQIDCEHAYGPSFQLSDRDLERLEAQIAVSPPDNASEGSVAVGWFIAHTRSDLVMTDREAELFRRLFPDPSRITVLAKPEKFKPTRYAFFVSEPDGTISSDGGSTAFSLPQQERATGVPLARERIGDPEEITPPPAPPMSEETSRSAPIFPVEPPSPPLPEPIVARPESVIARAELDSTGRTDPVSPLPRLPGVLPGSVASEEVASPGPSLLTWSLFGASVVFTALAVYGFYLRFVPPVVPINVTPNGDALIVSWPAAETRGVNDAELRINNGPAVNLSEEQKASGTFAVHAGGGDLMVDLVVHQRLRTLRGITRYVVTPAASAQ